MRWLLVLLLCSCATDPGGSIEGLPPSLEGEIADVVLVDRGGVGVSLLAVDVDVECPLQNGDLPSAGWWLGIEDAAPGVDREYVGSIVVNGSAVDLFGRLRIEGNWDGLDPYHRDVPLTATFEIHRSGTENDLDARGTLHARPCGWPAP